MRAGPTFTGTLAGIEPGIYQLDGLVYSGYFLRERTAPDQFLLDENFYYFEILTDGDVAGGKAIEFATSRLWEDTLDWLYGQAMGFLSDFFTQMNRMGAVYAAQSAVNITRTVAAAAK